MRIISVKKLKDFWNSGHADSEQSLKVWYQILKQENFRAPNEIKRLFPSASFVGNNRVIFNICGNKYRLVTYIMSLSTKMGPQICIKKGPLV